MADLLNIGISGLKVHQEALRTTGHNISNASTEGYTRQEVVIETGLAQFKGFGYVGTGAQVQEVRRIYDEFLIRQVRADTSNFSRLDTYKENIEQIDRLMADQRTGLTPALEDFFAGLQSGADNPAYVPTREVVLGTARSLVDRFKAIDQRLKDQNDVINGQLSSMVDEINALANGIAELNEKIDFARGNTDLQAPNDLLDQRDDLVRRLSEKIEVDVIQVDDSYNIAIGNGQPLVLDYSANLLEVVPGVQDPFRNDIRFVSSTDNFVVTDQLKGGQLGGTLDFRSEALDPAINALGRIAVGMSMEMNAVHHLGMDMEGQFGGDFFSDLNDPSLARDRVQSDFRNAPPNDRVMSVYFTDAGALSTSDYELRMTGPKKENYEVVRLNDDMVVASGARAGEFPESIHFDGIELVFESGSFQVGDRFNVQPMRDVVKDIGIEISRPADLAFAYPINGTASIGNTGTGTINQGQMLSKDTDIFAEEGKLTPPLMIKFEQENRYTVYDVTDPLRPKELSPPISHQPYVPGTPYQILPEDLGQTRVSSFRAELPDSPFIQLDSDPVVTPRNQIVPERISFEMFNEETNKWQPHFETINTELGATAQEIAVAVSKIPGVSAEAYNEVTLSNISDTDGTPWNPDQDMQIWLNGFNLTDTNLGEGQTIYAPGYPETTARIDADFLAGRINSHYELQDAGIVAVSDGVNLKIIDYNGGDIALELRGDKPVSYLTGSPPTLSGPPTTIGGGPSIPGSTYPGDSFRVSTGEVFNLDLVSGDTRGLLTEKAGFDFDEDYGPYVWEFSIPDGPQNERIELSGTYADGDAVKEAFIAEIEKVIDRPGEIDINIDERGNVSFQLFTTLTGQDDKGSSKLTVGGKLTVTMDENIRFYADPVTGGIFNGTPEAKEIFQGFQFEITGNPDVGDTFFIQWNEDGISDNRNALDLVALELKDTLNDDDGGMTFNESYSFLVGRTGSITREVQIDTEAATYVLEQTRYEWKSIAGVSLDEEGARLIEFEAAYNASAKIIQVAQELFDTLLTSF